MNHSVYTYDSIKQKESKNNRGIILEKDRDFTDFTVLIIYKIARFSIFLAISTKLKFAAVFIKPLSQ